MDDGRRDGIPSPFLPRLHHILSSCSDFVERGEFVDIEKSVSELVELLDDVLLSAGSEDAAKVLAEISGYVQSPSTSEGVVDAVSFELPKAICRFSGTHMCLVKAVDDVIDQLVMRCNPRDMLTIFCEALNCQDEKVKFPGYSAPIFSGISKAFLLIKRQHLNQVKAAVPVIVRALELVALDANAEDYKLDNLFSRAIAVASSVLAVSVKLECETSEKLRALLGLFVLQIVTHFTVSMGDNISSCLPLVSQLSRIFNYCGFSYIGLMTGSSVDIMLSYFKEDEEDESFTSPTFVMCGAALSVILGIFFADVAQFIDGDLILAQNELRHKQLKRWQAIGMLRHIFTSVHVPWTLKNQTIDFLLCITEGTVVEVKVENMDVCSFAPSIFATLQGIVTVIMYAAEGTLRKKAFNALRRVLADSPISQRYDILKSLILNSHSSSMTGILLDCMRELMQMESNLNISKGTPSILEGGQSQKTSSACAPVLELVEMVLRPSKGGPPDLPEQSDAVLSALNLYRFALLRETRGSDANLWGIVAEANLKKAYYEWLLPLRTLVTGILAENTSESYQVAVDAIYFLNPVELVLYRCIELVEEKLQHCSGTI